MQWREILITFYTLFYKEMVRIIRIWAQTLVPPVITTTLYFIIFGKLLGAQISDIHGFTYMQYIVPGLVISNMIANAYMNTVSSFYAARFQRSIEEMLVSPMPNYILLLGYVLSSIMRSLMTGALVLVIALFFTDLHIHSWFLVFLVGILASAIFAVVGFINGMYAKGFDDISWVPTFIITPLSYLGGVFYALEMLPPFWQKVSLLNPLMYIIDSFRFAALGASSIDAQISIIALITITVALFTTALYLLHKGAGIRQ